MTSSFQVLFVHMIVTLPRKIKGVLESFCNGGHRDSTDSIDDEQGRIVMDYINTINDPILNDSFTRLYTTFNSNRIKVPRMPLPTTCAWKLIEKPEKFSFKHMSYFIVSEVGISWDLSSHCYDESCPILGATFLGSLVEHSTSCSLWTEETSGYVTTICPGSANNFAWGRSGGKRSLKNTTLDLAQQPVAVNKPQV